MKLRAMHTTHATRKQRNATSIIWHSVPTSEDVLVFLSLIPQPLNFKFLVLLCWGSADDNLGPTFCLDWMQIHCYLISLLDCVSHFFPVRCWELNWIPMFWFSSGGEWGGQFCDKLVCIPQVDAAQKITNTETSFCHSVMWPWKKK